MNMSEEQVKKLDSILGGGPKVEVKRVEVTKWPFKKVLNNHLMIQIDDFKYSGRLHIPEVAKRAPTKGTVVGVADDITDIQVGDKILYSQFAGYLLRFEDTPLLRCIGYNEVLAILNEDSPAVASESA